MSVFQITNQEIEYSTLEPKDLGKWSYLVTGCYMLFDTYETAIASYQEVFRKN